MTTAAMLPGEGETRIQVRVHRTCERCSEPAKYKQTYLLEGTRSNPASSAYGRDDCSWCSDADAFFCEEHRGLARSEMPPAYVMCSRFEAGERFAHMFLRWETTEAVTP